MSVSSISDLSHQRMLSILGYSSAAQGQSNNFPGADPNSTSNSSSISPFAQMLTDLQQMEESNPGQYAKVSQQISSKLSTAASTAQSHGNTSLASQLNTLSNDFSTASQTGQLPNIGDLESMMQSVGYGASAAATAMPKSGSHAGVMSAIHQVLSLAGI